jgi:hypothetical protein
LAFLFRAVLGKQDGCTETLRGIRGIRQRIVGKRQPPMLTFWGGLFPVSILSAEAKEKDPPGSLGHFQSFFSW